MPSVKHPIVGTVSFQAIGSGRIRLLNNWEAQNISTVFIPELKGVPTYGGKFSGNVRFYTRAIPQLKAAFAEIGRLGLQGDIIFWDGSFVPRMKRGSSTSPSNHTFGTAFDINAEWNGFRQTPAAPGKKGSVWRLVPIFEKYGFECGARWKNTPDGMHFEVKKLLSYSTYPVPQVITQPEDKAFDGPLLCVWNGHPLPLEMVGERPFVAIRELLELVNHEIVSHSNQVAEKGRFYVNSAKKS